MNQSLSQPKLRVTACCELEVASEDDVTTVRHRVRTQARERGFDPFATAAIVAASSELARNALIHAGGGRVVIEELEAVGRVGLRLQVIDKGPGIEALHLAMQGGVSSINELGQGLSGSQRLVDDFRIDSDPGQGTVVTVTKWSH